jgi:hypothetical protein
MAGICSPWTHLICTPTPNLHPSPTHPHATDILSQIHTGASTTYPPNQSLVSAVTGPPNDTTLRARLCTSSVTHSFIYSIFIFKGHGITGPVRTNLNTSLAGLDLRCFYSSLCRQYEALSVNLLINQLLLLSVPES